MPATMSAKDVNELKKAPRVDGVLDIFLDRWSPRSFADREVSPELLHKVFEAARWAASSNNEQPWRYLMGRRGDRTWQRIFDTLADGNKKWAHLAPVLMINAAKSTFGHKGTPNRVALYDLGAATQCLCLEATALGLAAHQMAGFDTEAARKAFGIPEDYIVGAAIALGYEGEPTALGDEQLIEREVAPRTRMPLDKFVFSEWDKAAKF
jgi:nitroreductase